ncbi:S8 family serine peptidase [Herbidospora daliensis]|uniref:S8 family serine peptidase n=1 Tax=Herbidospora daliensis TaxID=295585 RepID=UPI000781EA7D|nr:S8 family serine peptidase [Herbidospora daliensis]
MLRAAALAAAALLAVAAAPPPLDDLGVDAAWAKTKGAGVTVALLHDRVGDSPGLKDRVVQAPDMTGTFFEGDEMRTNDYSTILAGLVAGDGAGGGPQGTAPEATVLSVPITSMPLEGGLVDPEGPQGTPLDSPIARGVRYAVNHGAQVIVIPMGIFGVGRIERDAVSYALQRDVVVVSGAGDVGQWPSSTANGTSYWQFPAGFPGVIGVAAVDDAGVRAPASSDNLSVLVAAPGVRIPAGQAGGRPLAVNGTQAASALVGGVAALIRAEYPRLPAELVARSVSDSAGPHPGNGYDDKVGFGVVNAGKALVRAGELARYQEAVPVGGDLHFGGGPKSPGPQPPGPDPLRLWVYGAGAVVSLAAFGLLAGLLARRRR